jgi:hypothetical protein
VCGFEMCCEASDPAISWCGLVFSGCAGFRPQLSAVQGSVLGAQGSAPLTQRVWYWHVSQASRARAGGVVGGRVSTNSASVWHLWDQVVLACSHSASKVSMLLGCVCARAVLVLLLRGRTPGAFPSIR